MIDYYTIQSDLHTIISAGTYTDGIKEFLIEAMDRDLMLGNMPFINIRLAEADIEIRSLPNGYYAYLSFKIDVVAFDFTEYKKAAIVRDRLMKEVQTVIQGNRAFSANVQTSSVGPKVTFSAGIADEDEDSRGHIAAATFEVVVEVSVEPN